MLPLLLLVTVHQSKADYASLVEGHRFFELREALQSDRRDTLELRFFRGIADNAFNRTASSLANLEAYIRTALPRKDDRRVKDAWITQADNYAKAQQYANAAKALSLVLARYRHTMTDTEAADVLNSQRLWDGLRDVPPQTIGFRTPPPSDASQEPILTLPVQVKDKTFPLMLDTGANLSIVRMGLVESLDIHLLPTTIMVDAITGNKVPARLGVAPRLSIRNVVVENVLFLVFSDRDMTLGGFRVDGVIGYPFASALPAVRLTHDGRFEFPTEPPSGSTANVALDGLTPIIQATFRGKPISMCLDTGANRTALWPPFYTKFREIVDKEGSAVKHNSTGVGGTRFFDSFRLTDAKIDLPGGTASFPRIDVIRDFGTSESQHHDGNLGRDAMRQFESMTISFKAMTVEFRPLLGR